MMKRKGSHYPFIILNTDRANSLGIHWWSILNIYPRKQLFLFDSYGFLGFKAFVEQDDCGLINKILYNTKKFNKKDNIVNLVTVTFSGENYEKLSQNQITKLVSTAADLFYLINEFAILNRIKIEVILHIADDQLQNKTSNTCEIFQLYFYKNLFKPLKKSKIINNNKLMKKTILTILTLLNEIFSTFDKKYEQVIEQFAK